MKNTETHGKTGRIRGKHRKTVRIKGNHKKNTGKQEKT